MELGSSLEGGEGTNELRLLLLEDDDDETFEQQRYELALPLCLLYSLNGVTLSLPATALLYIVNIRASIPVVLLPAYGSIAFLPFSLKPLYALASAFAKRQGRYHVITLLILLFVTSGVCNIATVFVPEGGVVVCFGLAFARGVSIAWPEFLLGLCLIRQAQSSGMYQVAAAHLQSQAATFRNLGSFLASILAFIIFVHQQYGRHDGDDEKEQLSDQVVTLLLVATGVLNFGGAMIALLMFRIDDPSITDGPDTVSLRSTQELLNLPCASASSTSSSFRGNCVLVASFQLTVIVLAMRQPLIEVSSQTFWLILLILLVMVLTLSLWRIRFQWTKRHCVGLFLFLRHSIPTCDYLMESFTYSLLQSTPMILQALGLVKMGVLSLSSWSYGKLFGGISHGKSLLWVIATTTALASLLSLTNIGLVATSGHNYDEHVLALAVVISALTTFAGEWQFLPDVVLATATVGTQGPAEDVLSLNDGGGHDVSHARALLEQGESYQRYNGEGRDACDDCVARVDSTGMEYGTLLSCIDFGDQVGSWVSIPLVAALGISRDNNWAHLDDMILLSAILGLMSIPLIGILRDKRNTN